MTNRPDPIAASLLARARELLRLYDMDTVPVDWLAPDTPTGTMDGTLYMEPADLIRLDAGVLGACAHQRLRAVDARRRALADREKDLAEVGAELRPLLLAIAAWPTIAPLLSRAADLLHADGDDPAMFADWLNDVGG